ncbi:hypothetical protein SNEBB_004526 [Seison nebaliae]|nr:hypothetical protein SNEBB_004526 [Seison nebaliae]
MYQYAKIVSIPKSNESSKKIRINDNTIKSKRCLKLKELINDNCHNIHSQFNDEFMELPKFNNTQKNIQFPNIQQNNNFSKISSNGHNYENRTAFSPKVRKIRKQVSFIDLNISMDEV